MMLLSGVGGASSDNKPSGGVTPGVESEAGPGSELPGCRCSSGVGGAENFERAEERDW